MKRSRIVVLGWVLVWGAGTLGGASAAAVDQPEWKPLMDGQTFHGWHPVGDGQWTVEEGAFVGRANQEKLYGLLVSDQTFKDFAVRLKFKCLSGDSGFYVRTIILPPDQAHGLQVQVGPPGSGTGGIYESYGRGWIARPPAEEEQKFLRANDWNEMTIEARGGKVVVQVNGIQTAEIKNDPSRPEGHLALQMHSGCVMEVRFKDLEIREYKAEEQPIMKPQPVRKESGHPQPISFQHQVIDAHGPQNPHIKAAGDINGDGRAEIIVASSAGGPLVWYEYPDWTRRVIAPSGQWSCDAALADLDGDGDLDLVISEWYTYHRIEWYENPRPDGDPAAGPWKRHPIGDLRAHDLEIGDLDGDGEVEIATRNQGQQGNQIVLWKRTAPDTWQSRILACPAGEGLALGDLNGDGKLELVIGGRWYEATGDILADPWAEHVFAEWPPDAVVKVADLNGDGRLDVVLTRSEGHHRLSWFEAPADPKQSPWKEHVVDDDVDYAHSLVVCDLNNDGKPDLVTAEMHQSPRKRVMVYLNAGDAGKWEKHVLAETGSHNLCVADVDGRGRLTLLGANWSGEYQPVEIWAPVRSES